MWYLDLLSKVLPAFVVLAKDYRDSLGDDAEIGLRRDAENCYGDLVLIAQIVSHSWGKWSHGLGEEENGIMGLLGALETRFPKSFGWSRFNPLSGQLQTTPESAWETRFQKLFALARTISKEGIGGAEHCKELLAFSEAEHERYLGVFRSFGRKIRLLHKEEEHREEKRAKFVGRIENAKQLLSDIFCPPEIGTEKSPGLSTRLNGRDKEASDGVYYRLEEHWRCACPQRYLNGSRSREVRVFPTSCLSTNFSSQKFRVLFPLCEDDGQGWKLANVDAKSSSTNTKRRERVRQDICRRLLNSRIVEADFLADKEKQLWHLGSRGIDSDRDHYQSMETLGRLLGDGVPGPVGTLYPLEERLRLCYSLSRVLLCFYPGPWLHTPWDSTDVYFLRTAGGPLWDLALPYLSVRLGPANPTTPRSEMWQPHLHPVILALGIVFLEITTGTRFRWSQHLDPVVRCNEDLEQAEALFKKLKEQNRRGGANVPLLSGLQSAIQACLKLDPPPDLPTNQLSEERTVRRYILGCIVHPLEQTVTHGFGRRLDEAIEPGAAGRGQRTRDPYAASIASTQDETPDQREVCLCGGEEDTIDRTKIKATEQWFQFYDNMLVRVYRDGRSIYRHGQKKVAIAILDSGIELSETQQDQYFSGHEVAYRSWVDDEALEDDRSQDWKDDAGHGTHLATLLARVAPAAAIHVARVFKRSKPDLEKETKNVAQAIWHAVDEWKVDIIVMSFGFAAPQGAPERRDSIRMAIRHAAAQGVGLFAAASNDGKNRPDEVAWPARELEVICVHSFDGDGNPSAFTPGAGNVQTVGVLGEAVRSAWPERLSSPRPGQRYMSGTSCATPIAAGIAAVVLDYARAFLTDEDWLELRRVGGLRRVFDKMTHFRTRGYSYIRPWQIFGKEQTDGWIQGQINNALAGR